MISLYISLNSIPLIELTVNSTPNNMIGNRIGKLKIGNKAFFEFAFAIKAEIRVVELAIAIEDNNNTLKNKL